MQSSPLTPVLCLLGRGVVAVVTAITLSTTGCCLVITRLFHLGISECSLINSLSFAAGCRLSTGCHQIDNHPLRCGERAGGRAGGQQTAEAATAPHPGTRSLQGGVLWDAWLWEDPCRKALGMASTPAAQRSPRRSASRGCKSPNKEPGWAQVKSYKYE